MRKATDVSTPLCTSVMLRHDAGTLSRRLQNQANMMAVVAHDLRHPLFRISLAADLASEIENDREALERSLAMIREGLASMSRLVEDLDDYGSLQAGRLQVVRRPLAPSTIVESAIGAFTPMAATKQIGLSARAAKDLPVIVADRDRLFQVVSNLLVNAFCVTPPGGVVEISAERAGDETRFAVSDSGPGIAPADLPRLFDRYWRGGNAYVGRGLGLTIARDLVESHGGRIWADNVPPGGACISFTIRD